MSARSIRRQRGNIPVQPVSEILKQTSFRNSLVLSALALGAAVVGSNAFAQGPRRQQASMALGDRHHSGQQRRRKRNRRSGTVVGPRWTCQRFVADRAGHFRRPRPRARQRKLDRHSGDGRPGQGGTLVCDTDGSASGQKNSVIVDTPLVDLDDEGDAQFNGRVSLPRRVRERARRRIPDSNRLGPLARERNGTAVEIHRLVGLAPQLCPGHHSAARLSGRRRSTFAGERTAMGAIGHIEGREWRR
jgi:hypothetical protein